MGRGGKVQSKKNSKRKIRSRCKGSDESDEDYTVGEDEDLNYSEDEESQESFGEFEEEEEEEEVRKVGRLKGQKTLRGRKKFGSGKVRKRSRVSYRLRIGENFEDQDHGDDDGEPDEIGLDEEEELAVQKKKDKVVRRPLRKKGVFIGRKRKRNYGVTKKPMKKKPRKRRRLLRKSVVGNDGAYKKKKLIIEERGEKNTGQRKRKFTEESDSDFVSSGSSDYEYTISEEEKEQVREASEFCGDLTTSLRNSSSIKIEQEEGILCQQRKRSGRKGKEKVDDLKNETGKQFCGICLSEEVKKTVRGTLNCCNHFFCFSCIMEWSKVESRCPLCKQRFVTISKPTRSDMGFDLRTVVIQIPERDQVYQPSEEELRGYLYPYDNAICTECHQSGDDALMLLCDLCDSPAHTYCVGLGHEVPEGSWYCEVCRPTGSSNVQAPNLTSDQRTVRQLSGRWSPVGNVREDIDLNSDYVPETPLGQGSEVLSSSGRSVGNFQAASPVSGIGVLTVSERRRIQRQIHNLLNNSIISQLGGRNGMPATPPRNNLSGSQPTALGAANLQAPSHISDQRTIRELNGRSSPVENVREDIDLNSAYVPETPLGQGSGVLSSPRRSVGNFQAASPVPGTGALTVSERRRMQHEIHHLLNNTIGRWGGRNGMPAPTPGNNLLGFQMERVREVGLQNAMIPERLDSYQAFSHGRLQENFTPPTLGRDLFSARSSNSRGQLLQGQTSNSADGFVNGMLESGVAGISGVINSRSGHEQIHPYASRSSNADDSMASCRYRDVGHLTAQKEQVQSLVRSHLKTLSRRMEIGYSTFKEIARSSTHTILAACDLEHRASEVYPVHPPAKCNHVEGIMSGEPVSLMKDCCSSCFESFVKNVVWEIAGARVPSVA
ncbi:uncharacterized protein LOC127802387 [Diospyros lotus]|uniref:uncharacterized protein LOC127802387 n=1 Tax=Diospyros lotus TaxID=55363 RepID=UPI00225AF685|nr:uncharacterized protein LOC127802387 [Diospyros lotus]XP_052194116.1 uncharacterized protein LOC127802387 [Diospyros lotus]